MAELYVATDAGGREWRGAVPTTWPLPDGGPGEPLAGDLALYTSRALLGRLDERIHRAEALDPVSGRDEEGPGGAGPGDAGIVRASRASLVETTPWDGFAAAELALDCAEHVLGEAAGKSLPDGTPLSEALARVRDWLSSSEERDDGPLDRLRDLALCWRLRREGRAIGDVAFQQAVEDIGADLDTLDDPTWTAIAAARDAVLAAVEAVQHAVFPRLSSYEAHRYEERERDMIVGSGAVASPLSAADPIVVRAGPRPSWVPAWIAADDAAERARQAAGDAGGPEAEAAELQWQAARLAEILGQPRP